MSINEFSHYLLFPGLFVAFTYNKKQPPAFGAAPAFWCILLSFLGLSFRHIPNNLSNYNVLTANAARTGYRLEQQRTRRRRLWPRSFSFYRRSFFPNRVRVRILTFLLVRSSEKRLSISQKPASIWQLALAYSQPTPYC